MFFESAHEMSILILKEVCNGHITHELAENVSDWVNFALNEFFLYKKYNQFELSLCSVLLGLRMAGMENQIANLVQFINFNNLADISHLQTCIKQMVALTNQSEDEPSENHVSTVTSTGSSEESGSVTEEEHQKGERPPENYRLSQNTTKFKKKNFLRKNKNRYSNKRLIVSLPSTKENKNMRNNKNSQNRKHVNSHERLCPANRLH